MECMSFQIAEPVEELGKKEEDRTEVKKADHTTKMRGILDDDDDDDDDEVNKTIIFICFS